MNFGVGLPSEELVDGENGWTSPCSCNSMYLAACSNVSIVEDMARSWMQ